MKTPPSCLLCCHHIWGAVESLKTVRPQLFAKKKAAVIIFCVALLSKCSAKSVVLFCLSMALFFLSSSVLYFAFYSIICVHYCCCGVNFYISSPTYNYLCWFKQGQTFSPQCSYLHSIMWTSDSNSENKFATFASAVGSAETAGSWQQDYEACCATNKIEPCPFFKVAETSPTTSSCRLINTAIDLASWRAMLVAAGSKNSSVVEIVCHNVRLRKQHLTDLISFVKASEALVSIKLDYLDFVSEGEGEEATTLGGGLLPLLAEASNIRFLSLKGNELDTTFTTAFSDTLMILPCLEGLNLSENNINDEGVAALFKVFPFCISLKQVALKKNPITGAVLESHILELVQGAPLGSTGEASLKNMQKVVADKNKLIQAQNKNKKKANLEESPEVVVPPNRVVSSAPAGKSGDEKESRVLNCCIELLDFSQCDFGVTVMTSFLAAAVSCTAAVVPPAEGPPAPRGLVIRVRGLDADNAATLKKEIFSGQISVQH